MENIDLDKIVSKIDKLFALAEKNPEAQEAIQAAAKAQELIAKYNIELDKLGISKEEEIVTETCYPGVGNKWKYQLARVVARNFRCKHYMHGKQAIVFYGYKQDTTAARRTFEFLFKTGNRLADKEYNRVYLNTDQSTKGVKNTFLLGFISGIRSVLDEQCKALMITVPTQVETGFSDLVKGFGTIDTSIKFNPYSQDSFERGHKAGRAAMQSRSIRSGALELSGGI